MMIGAVRWWPTPLSVGGRSVRFRQHPLASPGAGVWKSGEPTSISQPNPQQFHGSERCGSQTRCGSVWNTWVHPKPARLFGSRAGSLLFVGTWDTWHGNISLGGKGRHGGTATPQPQPQQQQQQQQNENYRATTTTTRQGRNLGKPWGGGGGHLVSLTL